MKTPDFDKLSPREYLPFAFKREPNDIILSLLETYEITIRKYYEFWTEYQLSLNASTIEASLLDYLATETINPWRNLWDSNWKESTKRLLLRDTQKIFSKRLFPETIELLFSHFGILSKLRPKTGFILGATTPPASNLPATLGTSIVNYEVVVPKQYYQGSVEYQQTKFIIDNFGMPANIPIIIE